MAALRAGKPEAFHRFYEAWFPRVLAFARSERPDEEDARALCERVFRRILRELPGFSGRVALARLVLAACVLEAGGDASEARPPSA